MVEPGGELEVAYRVIMEKVWELGVRRMVPDVGELAARVSRERLVKPWSPDRFTYYWVIELSRCLGKGV